MTLLLVSFVAGVLTVLAPCVLPLLPVVIGGSVSGAPSARRAFTITAALAASVFVFTLALKVSTAFIGIPQSAWEYLSGGILVIVGALMLFPSLWGSVVPASLNSGGNRLMAQGNAKQSFWGDVIIGAALGPVFSSCSPTYFILLATVLPVHFVAGLIYLIAYCVGLALMLAVVAIAGQRIMSTLGWASDPKGWVKRTIGVIFVLLGVLIFFGIDKEIEAALPASAFGITNVETSILQLTRAANSTNTETSAKEAMPYPKAPDLVSPDAYLNTGGQPISISQYVGKDVVLVDFWTYSCINCLRSLPYVESWYQKYGDEGLVVIGVHTPEFSFEHVLSNVRAAVTRLGITYPVVLDNEYKTWNAFGNEYWPAEYLIDIDGYVAHTQFGEGDYEVTEKAIQAALAERAERLGEATSTIAALATTTTTIAEPDLNAIQSSETYFGSARNEYLGNGVPGTAGVQQFALPIGAPGTNTLYLGGSWDIQDENATATAGDTALYYYDAHNLYFVASGAASSTATVEVLRDGQPVGSAAGSDVDPTTSTATISDQRLYNLIQDPAPGPHTVELKVLSGSLAAYTFTFG